MITFRMRIMPSVHYKKIKEIWDKKINGEGMMMEDILDYYESKANIFLQRWEDSNHEDDRILMKVMNSIHVYESIEEDLK